jgi:hypothetical protein
MAMIYKIVMVAITAIVVLVLLTRNTSKWARSLQGYYIAQSHKISGDSGGWDESWRLTLFKALVVFFGLMVILGVHVVVFSLRS